MVCFPTLTSLGGHRAHWERWPRWSSPLASEVPGGAQDPSWHGRFRQLRRSDVGFPFNGDYQGLGGDLLGCPGGLVIPGSYVFLGGSGTANLAEYIAAGETNRVVITQVDDCAVQNNLWEARVVLNGSVISTNNPPSAVCLDIIVALDGGGNASIAAADVDGGSDDPDGSIVSRSVSPSAFD